MKIKLTSSLVVIGQVT